MFHPLLHSAASGHEEMLHVLVEGCCRCLLLALVVGLCKLQQIHVYVLVSAIFSFCLKFAPRRRNVIIYSLPFRASLTRTPCSEVLRL